MIVIRELAYRRNRYENEISQLNAKSIELTYERATFNERLQRSKTELGTTISNFLDPAFSLAAAGFDPDIPGRTTVTNAKFFRKSFG